MFLYHLLADCLINFEQEQIFGNGFNDQCNSLLNPFGAIASPLPGICKQLFKTAVYPHQTIQCFSITAKFRIWYTIHISSLYLAIRLLNSHVCWARFNGFLSVLEEKMTFQVAKMFNYLHSCLCVERNFCFWQQLKGLFA